MQDRKMTCRLYMVLGKIATTRGQIGEVAVCSSFIGFGRVIVHFDTCNGNTDRSAKCSASCRSAILIAVSHGDVRSIACCSAPLHPSCAQIIS